MPEAEDYLDKAREDFDDARKIIEIPLPKVAARTAYYAAFRAAEAFIIVRTGKVAKTHSGVRAEFARLLHHAPKTARELRTKRHADHMLPGTAGQTRASARRGEAPGFPEKASDRGRFRLCKLFDPMK
jgi:uncharacterized protein (UPF0332 family)